MRIVRALPLVLLVTLRTVAQQPVLGPKGEPVRLCIAALPKSVDPTFEEQKILVASMEQQFRKEGFSTAHEERAPECAPTGYCSKLVGCESADLEVFAYYLGVLSKADITNFYISYSATPNAVVGSVVTDSPVVAAGAWTVFANVPGQTAHFGGKEVHSTTLKGAVKHEAEVIRKGLASKRAQQK